MLHRADSGSPRGLVLFLHALAEEMNKSRRMVALQARALAATGFDVLQIDLRGCGDSSGDFGDASWQDWLDDGRLALEWLARQPGAAELPLTLWGHRAGALLAVELARNWHQPCHLLLWQPATAGKLVLQQFLRLRLAADMLGGQAKGAMQGLRDALSAGQDVEIAGYRLSPGLSAGLDAADLSPVASVRSLCWLELSKQPEAELSMASTRALEPWQAAGVQVRTAVVAGPAFWMTTEIEEAPDLVRATTALLNDEEVPA